MRKCTKTIVKPENDVRCRDIGSEEITICGRNEGVEMDGWSHQAGAAGQTKKLNN